jgi:hypothetical protein
MVNFRGCSMWPRAVVARQQNNLQQHNPKRRHSFHDPVHDGDGQRSNYVV